MQKTTTFLLAGALALAGTNLFAQGKGAAGDAAKGKAVFEQCSVCHNADSAEVKMGPGLKGLYKRKLSDGKQASDATVGAKIDAGGGGMPSYKDLLSAAEKANVIAYLKTL